MDEQTLERVRAAGRMVFAVEGMWCASCAMALQHALSKVRGVREVSVNFISSAAMVSWHPVTMDFSQLLARTAKLGYRLMPAGDSQNASDTLENQADRIRLQLVIAAVFGMWSMLGSWILYLNPQLGEQTEGIAIAWLSLVAGVPVIFYSGLDFLRMSVRTLRAGIAGMDALISLGALGALLVSLANLVQGRPAIYIDAATMLITFLLIGRLLEIHARQDSGAALEALARLIPELAVRIDRDDAEEVVPLVSVSPGDLVLVRAGERVSVDGIVENGCSTLDGSLMTGESSPFAIGIGERVDAGFVNLSAPLYLRVVAGQGRRRIDALGLRMLELFGQRSSLSMAAERFVRWILPIVLLLAVLSFARHLWLGDDVGVAAIAALSMLVAACPCAVGVSMPLAYAIAVRKAADHGILWRDPASIEGLAEARVMAFDKTGTLTTGELLIDEVQVIPGEDESKLLQTAWLAEVGVVHPVASALRSYAMLQGWRAPHETPMAGTSKRHVLGAEQINSEGQRILVGARRWLVEQGVLGLPADADGPGVIHLAREGQWIGSIRFKDQLRDNARPVLQELAEDHMELWLVTGDTTQAVEYLTDQLGIRFDQEHSSCSPEEKAEIIRAERHVVFVGDGVNDGLVLASSGCGIAVPGASSVAVTAAGMVVVEGGLNKIAWARCHARKTLRIVRQNLGFSMAYNLAVAGILFFSDVTPFAAAVAMLLSSLSVFINAGRLGWGNNRWDKKNFTAELQTRE